MIGTQLSLYQDSTDESSIRAVLETTLDHRLPEGSFQVYANDKEVKPGLIRQHTQVSGTLLVSSKPSASPISVASMPFSLSVFSSPPLLVGWYRVGAVLLAEKMFGQGTLRT